MYNFKLHFKVTNCWSVVFMQKARSLKWMRLKTTTACRERTPFPPLHRHLTQIRGRHLSLHFPSVSTTSPSPRSLWWPSPGRRLTWWDRATWAGRSAAARSILSWDRGATRVPADWSGTRTGRRLWGCSPVVEPCCLTPTSRGGFTVIMYLSQKKLCWESVSKQRNCSRFPHNQNWSKSDKSNKNCRMSDSQF